MTTISLQGNAVRLRLSPAQPCSPLTHPRQSFRLTPTPSFKIRPICDNSATTISQDSPRVAEPPFAHHVSFYHHDAGTQARPTGPSPYASISWGRPQYLSCQGDRSRRIALSCLLVETVQTAITLLHHERHIIITRVVKKSEDCKIQTANSIESLR